MEIRYEPELLAFMERKGHRCIAVEVMTSDHSDFEVTELYVHLISDKRADYFKKSRRFVSVPTAAGEILLPPYRLEYDQVLTFGLKTHLFGIKTLSYEGIRL